MKFKSKKQRKKPEFNTTALPDIIFLLLFFFMVATVLKTQQVKTSFKLPEATQLTEMKKQVQILNIYLGIDEQENKTQIQADEHLVPMEKLSQLIASIKAKTTDKELVVALKADKRIKMYEVNEVKTMLRKQNLRKITYVSEPRALTLN